MEDIPTLLQNIQLHYKKQLTSTQKCIKKSGHYLSTPYVLLTKYVELKDGRVSLPLYMTGVM